MSFFIAGQEGLEVVTTREGQYPYCVPLGTTPSLDLSAFWSVVPSDLSLMGSVEKRLLENLWRGSLQITSDLMRQTAHLSRMGSLTDFPQGLVRSWQPVQTWVSSQWATDASLIDNFVLSGVSRWETESSGAEGRNRFDLHNLSQQVFVGKRLRSAVGSSCVLRAHVEFRFRTQGSRENFLVVGYGSLGVTPHAMPSSGLWVILSTEGRIGLVTCGGSPPDTEGMDQSRVRVVWDTARLSATPGAELRLEMWYDGVGSGLKPGLSPTLTLRISNLDTGTQVNCNLQVPLLWRRTDGEIRLDPWWGEAFGFWTIHPAWSSSLGLSTSLDALLSVYPQTCGFLDPTVDVRVQWLPVLQPTPNTPEGFLVSEMDFVLIRGKGFAWLRFEKQPPDQLWAEAVAYDTGLLKRVFGPLTGVEPFLEDEDGIRLQNQITGALYGLMAGPNLPALSVALGGLLGAPVVVRPGVVTAITTQQGRNVIVVDEGDRERVYPYPEGMTPRVQVGDAVSPFVAVVEPPNVGDWLTASSQLAQYLQHEAQRFSAVFVSVPSAYLLSSYNALPRPLTSDAVGDLLEGFSQRIRTYLSEALGLWVGLAQSFLGLSHTESDETDLSDVVVFSGRRDRGRAEVLTLPANAAGTAEFEDLEPSVGDLLRLVDVEALFDGFVRDGKSGFTWRVLEYTHAQYPRDRSQFTVREAMTEARDPRYDDPRGYVYAADPLDPDLIPGADMIYDEAEIWTLDTRVSITASYTGADMGARRVEVYSQVEMLSHGQTHTFREPDYWDERPVPNSSTPPNLDFSDPDNSHWIPGI